MRTISLAESIRDLAALERNSGSEVSTPDQKASESHATSERRCQVKNVLDKIFPKPEIYPHKQAVRAARQRQDPKRATESHKEAE